MILIYVCAYIGATLLLLAILMLLWMSTTKVKEADRYLAFFMSDNLTILIMLMALIGCILLGTSTVAEVHMLGEI